MKTWSIGKKLGVTTCATGLVIVVLAGLSFWSIRALQAVIDDAYDVDVRKAIAAGRVDEEAHAMVGHEEAAVSSALQQNAPHLAADLREFDEAARGLQASIAELDALAENDAEHQAIEKVRALVGSWRRVQVDLTSALRAYDVPAAVALQDG